MPNFAEIGWKPKFIDALAAAKITRPAASHPGLLKIAQSRMVPVRSVRKAALEKKVPAIAARAAAMNIADGASIQFSKASTARHPKAAPTRSTP